jgi:hypothetical protein
MRRYRLASVETRGSDTSYSLVFTTGGRMYVRRTTGYEQAYKTGDVSEIDPSDFASVSVDGVPLSELVTRKLEEILPLTRLEWPDVPHLQG